MELRDTVKAGLKEEHKRLDIDSFGEIVDGFIRKSKVALLVYKEENEADFHVQGAGVGAVMDFYLFLNALGPIFERMLAEMDGKENFYAEKLIDALLEEIRKVLRETAGG